MIATKQKRYKFEPDYAVAPGETLRETMESLAMSQKELAKRKELTVQTLNRIVKGEQPISYETANRLEFATNVPASIWNNLESNYREQLVKLKERDRLKKDLKWLDSIPIKELIERQIIPSSSDKVQLVRDTLKFYGVSSADSWYDIWEQPAIAARRSPCFESRPGAASAWIRIGELNAQRIDCNEFNSKIFRSSLTDIRKLSKSNPDHFIPEMVDICAESGVAVVLTPRLKKVPWSGATKWLSPNKAMILLSLRGKFEDFFWFSFFHEAGHVLHDSKKDLLINDGTRKDDREIRADEFAADLLIPAKYNSAISNIRSNSEVLQIAEKLEISPGIVVGRYHHLTRQWKLFNRLRNKFQWA